MNALRNWKILLCLAGIFIIGAITGGAITVKVVRVALRRNLGFEEWPQTTMQRYHARLELTEEQARKVQPILNQTGRELRETAAGAFFQIASTIQRNNERVAAELTAEQRKRFAAMNEDARRRFEQQLRRRPAGQ
jgi:hypothetical protein